MAALLVVCVTMLAMVSKGLTVPAGARQGRDRLTAEFLTDYLNQQQRLPVQVKTNSLMLIWFSSFLRLCRECVGE